MHHHILNASISSNMTQILQYFVKSAEVQWTFWIFYVLQCEIGLFSCFDE